MKNWRKVYDEAILKLAEKIVQGKASMKPDYYLTGTSNHVYRAEFRVDNKLQYTCKVKLNATHNQVESANCTCGVRHCAHTASLLLALEKQGKLQVYSGDNKETYPVLCDWDRETYFFDLPKLYQSLPFDEEDWLEALQDVETTDFELQEIGIKDGVLEGVVARNAWDLYFSKINFRISPTKVEYIRRERKKSWSQEQTLACVLIMEYILAENPNPAISTDADGFFNAFKTFDKLTKPTNVNLVFDPEFYFGDEGVYLRVRIRELDKKRKGILIKDFPKFFQAYYEQESYQLTTVRSLDFAKQRLSSRDERLLTFLAEEKRYEVNIMDRWDRSKGSEVFLGSSRIERTLELIDHIEVEKTSYQLRDGTLDLKARYQYVTNGEVKLELDLGKHLITEQYIYIFNTSKRQNYLERCKVGIKQATFLRLLSENADVEGHMEQLVSPQQFSQLEKVLERLKVMGQEVNGPELKLPVNETAPQITYYLDVDADNFICQVEATYDGQTYPLMLNKYGQIKGAALEKRDAVAETAALSLVHDNFTYDEQNSRFMLAREQENTVYLLQELLPDMEKLGTIEGTKAFKRVRIFRQPKFEVGIRVENGLLSFTMGSDSLSPDELADIFKQYVPRKTFYKLKSGAFVEFDESEKTLQSLMETMETLGVSAKEFTAGKLHLPLYRALYLDAKLQERDDLVIDQDQQLQDFITKISAFNQADLPLPDGLKATLRPYQLEGYHWLATLASGDLGGILADDMGLGKTVQLITLLLAAKDQKISAVAEGQTLIITPAALLYNWQNEFEKFAPSLKIGVVAGTKAQRRAQMAQAQDYDVLLTTYDLLKRDVDLYEACHFRYQVIDEAQHIKNKNTQAAKAVKNIQAVSRFALTGTPIENQLSELWSIFDYTMAGYLFSYPKFRQEFETPIVTDQNEEVQAQLVKMIQPFVLRRRKEEVLKDLPEKIEEPYYAKMGTKQAKLYQALVTELKVQLGQLSEDEFKRDKLAILAQLTKIRQLCCDPNLLYADYQGESAKTLACLSLIESAIDGGHRILLFSQFTSMLEVLEKHLTERKIAYYKITGQTSKAKRVQLVDEFNHGEVPVFLISLKAGGTGLNLTGADMVIHYDPWWNAAAQNQATDRAHRIGQTNKVMVYKLIVKDSLEEKIMDMQAKKAKLADDILSGKGLQDATITREELLEII